MKKNNIYSIIIYLCIVYGFVMYHYTSSWGFSGIEQLVTVHDKNSGKIAPFLLLLNLSISVIYIFTVMNSVSQCFLLRNYIITRSSKRRFISLTMFEVAKSIIILTSIKTAVSFTFSISETPYPFMWLLFLFFSYAVTFLVWGSIIIFLMLRHIPTKFIYFSVIASVLILQLLSRNRIVSLFVAVSVHYKQDYLYIAIGKAVILLLLLAVIVKTSQKYEIL